MYRRSVLWVFLLLLVSGILTASPWHFRPVGIGGHPEILDGFLPTSVAVEGAYDGFSFLQGNRTELQTVLAVGYDQRKRYRDPANGSVLASDPLVYDVFHTDWVLAVSQGFFPREDRQRDLLTVHAGYVGNLEVSLDSMASTDDTISSWFDSYGDLGSSSPYYPDIGTSAGTMFLGTSFFAGLSVDGLEAGATTKDGWTASLVAAIAPSALNDLLDGNASFHMVGADVMGAKTLYVMQDDKKRNILSLVLVDRLGADWVDGDAVPDSIGGPVSLGAKVRGFLPSTYDTQWTLVNKLDLQINGPEPLDTTIFPRASLFLDMGWGGGSYFNTDRAGSNFLVSTGLEMGLTFYDTIDLGYRVSYLLDDNVDVPIVGTVVLALSL